MTGLQSRGDVPGRRERKQAATRASIFEAACALFQDRPFDDVTVQQIAERADLGVGTLFYHAPNKVEMFLMVYNVTLEQAITEGEAAESVMPQAANLSDRIMSLVLPIARLTESPQVVNLVRYHRELLFGDSDGPHRREGIELVRRLEQHLAAVLCAALGGNEHSHLARLTARTIFAALHFDIALSGTDLNSETGFVSNGEPRLKTQIDTVVRGFAAQVSSGRSGDATPSTVATCDSTTTPTTTDTALLKGRS